MENDKDCIKIMLANSVTIRVYKEDKVGEVIPVINKRWVECTVEVNIRIP